MNSKALCRFSGTVTAALLLAAQMSALPANGASLTSKPISACNFTAEINQELTRGDGIELTVGQFGAGVTDVVKEVWVEYEADVSSGKPTMPAFGYTAPGLNEYDWYSDGNWMDNPTSSFTVTFAVDPDYPIPAKFSLQLWGEEEKTLDTLTVKTVGLVTGELDDIGMATRKGDVDDSKEVNVADAVALAKYLTCESDTLANPANGDLDGNNRLNAIDLTLLKQGILNGDFNKQSTDETAMEFVKHIKLGWNLGNTLDAQSPGWAKTVPTEAETSWGNPVTSKAMIDAVKAAGFNLVRVPVSWGAKMNNDTYKINDDWMNRVQEIVNYAIDNDMYCILNIHHDNSKEDEKTHVPTSFPYFYPDSAHYEQSEKFVKAVWSQVAERFEGYDNHLIFETLNEPRLIGHTNEWWINPSNPDCVDAMDCVNKLNAAALKSIRETGGNNAKRFVMMPTYAASPDTANLNGMSMPADDHLIAEIHAYRPYAFALANDGTQVDTFDASKDGGEVVSFMNALKGKFLNNGIPVIIDEFGAMNRNNEAERAEWAKFYLETADSFGIPCVWWDNNAFSGEGENFGLINRGTLSVQYPSLMQAMVEATKNRG
ncbi:MAG TPA: hypothetical protein DDX71_06565 [Ruminococcus sp.]|nr:hypothetical protein [Ruminococcus sp.]